MSRYRDAAIFLAGFVIALIVAVASPSQAQEAEPLECIETAFYVEGQGCVPKPPTAEQRADLEKWGARADIASVVLDGGSTAVAVVGFGAKEVGLAAVCGPAWPVCLIGLKVGEKLLRDRQVRKMLARGEYDRAITLLKVRAGVFAGAGAFNTAQMVVK